MTTSPTTSDLVLRNALLDIVYGQWRQLGIPFTQSLPPGGAEVIDPEALITCSLELLPTEPRLAEAVAAWLAAHRHLLVPSRLNRLIAGHDERALAWNQLDHPTHPAGRSAGPLAPGPATALLRARALLGRDLRHALLVYLLAHPDGARLRDIQRWSRFTYRAVALTASHWQDVGALVLDHGFARLTQPRPWRQLLDLDSGPLVVADWPIVFDAAIALLRAIDSAERDSIPLDSPVITALRRDALAAITDSASHHNPHLIPFLTALASTIRD